jgi:hypothetical protein
MQRFHLTEPISLKRSDDMGRNFMVTANPGGQTAVGIDSPIMVAGLSNGVTYSFTISARNSNGLGTPSSLSDTIVPGTRYLVRLELPQVADLLLHLIRFGNALHSFHVHRSIELERSIERCTLSFLSFAHHLVYCTSF